MRTDDLIAALAERTLPVQPGALFRRMALALAIGTTVVTGLVIALYGLRTDFALATTTSPFWIKAVFTGSVAALALIVLVHASRPHRLPQTLFAVLGAPFVVIAVLGVNELYHTAPADRLATVLGQTWMSCPFSIAGLALVPMVLILRALRTSAPASPTRTGMVVGLLAGGAAATAYGLHCPEAAVSFIAAWYAIGILLSAMLGAVAGWRLLRW